MAIPKAKKGEKAPGSGSIGDWGKWLREKGIKEYNPEVEKYAREKGLSYEKAAYGMYYGGGTGETGDYVKDLIKVLTEDVVPKALEFDSEAARRAAEEQWGPHYDEILQNYQQEVEIKTGREKEDLATYLESVGIKNVRAEKDLATRLDALGLAGTRAGEDLAKQLESLDLQGVRTEEDLTTKLEVLSTRGERVGQDLTSLLGLLGGRREEYMANIARESPLIQEAIGTKAADRGMYFSGGRGEQQKLQLEKEERGKETYEKEYGYQTGKAQKGAERSQADIAKGKDLAQQSATRTRENIARSRAASEKTEARTQETLARQRLLEQQQFGRGQEDLQRQQEQRELQSTRYLADVERARKERERTLAQERERAVTGQVQTLREEQLLGY